MGVECKRFPHRVAAHTHTHAHTRPEKTCVRLQNGKQGFHEAETLCKECLKRQPTKEEDNSGGGSDPIL